MHQVRSKLGQGTFADVFSADVVSGKGHVALKIVKPESDIDFGPDNESGVTYDDVLQAFRDEFKLLETLGKHPAIVGVIGVSDAGRVLVMEQAQHDLFSIVRKMRRKLPLDLAKQWAQNVLEGVAYIHSMGIIHQDMKSSNILIYEDNNARICDFGLSCYGGGQMEVDREIITLWYRAPELLMGSLRYTPKVDEWGVGCILLEMMIGTAPFHGDADCGCRCSSIAHCNFNADQLKQIFKVIGTPRDEDSLHGMHCVNHFSTWNVYPPALEPILRSARPQDASADASEFQAWIEVIEQLLQLHSKRRDHAHQALRRALFRGVSSEPSSSECSDASSPLAAKSPSRAHHLGAAGGAAAHERQQGMLAEKRPPHSDAGYMPTLMRTSESPAQEGATGSRRARSPASASAGTVTPDPPGRCASTEGAIRAKQDHVSPPKRRGRGAQDQSPEASDLRSQAS
jgi:cyclin-dependent kinase